MVMTTGLNNYHDRHYTPGHISEYIVDYFRPKGKILEPCRGNGSFMKYLPDNTLWCEIDEGKDFFEFQEKIDWIITNPPYSILTQWMDHCFQLADNVVLLIPISKLFSSNPRLQMVREYGGISDMIVFGPGRSIGIDLGFPMGAIKFSREWKGETNIKWYKETEWELLLAR
jgi:hypothetical protein